MGLSNPVTALRLLALLLLSLRLGALPALAQSPAEPPAGSDEADLSGEALAASTPRHRLDSSFSFVDTSGLDSLGFSFAYTFNLTPNTNLSLVVPVVDGDIDDFGPYGVGDVGLIASFTPFTRISANPWVPKTVGTGLALVLPTGDAAQGRGLDSVVVNPFVGGALPLSDSFFVLPQVAYFHSVDPTYAELDIRQGTLSVGLTWISSNAFWISPLVECARDFVTNEWAFNWEVHVGKMFSSGLGVSLSYFDYELLDPVTGAGLGKAGDQHFTIALFYAF